MSRYRYELIVRYRNRMNNELYKPVTPEDSYTSSMYPTIEEHALHYENEYWSIDIDESKEAAMRVLLS